MPKTKRDSGAEVLTSVLQLIPEAQRGTIQETLSDPAIQAAVADLLGDGVLRQQDYSRAMNELQEQQTAVKTWHESLKTWHAENAGKLQEYERLKAAGGRLDDDPPPTSTKLPDNVVTKDDFTKTLADRDAQWAGFFAVAQPLAFQHFQRFGEALDVNALMAEAQRTGKSFQAAYETHYAEKIQAYQVQQTQKAEADLRAKIEAEVKAKYSGQASPYPIGVPSTDPSVVDALGFGAKPNGTPEDFTVEAAAREYMQAVARQAAGGGTPTPA